MKAANLNLPIKIRYKVLKHFKPTKTLGTSVIYIPFQNIFDSCYEVIKFKRLCQIPHRFPQILKISNIKKGLIPCYFYFIIV